MYLTDFDHFEISKMGIAGIDTGCPLVTAQ